MSIKQVLVLISAILLFYGFLIEPNLIFVKKITLKSNDIKNLKIVFISDFHFSKFAYARLKRIIGIINKQNADIIISGGDYITAHNAGISMNMKYAASEISKMKSKYGIYSVLGNHDYYKDEKYVKSNLKKYGIKILENNNYELIHEGKPLFIAGISDMQTTFYNLGKALNKTYPPVILVSHSPDIIPSAENRVNLILSGHTHGGQVRIPFYGAVIVPSKYGKTYESGFINNIAYITKGLGTSILHLRFNCPPEITVIEYI